MTDKLRYILGLINEMHDTFLTDQAGFDRWLSSHDMYFVNGDYWADSFIDFFVCIAHDLSEKNWRKSYSYYEIFDTFFGPSVHVCIPASVVDNFDEFENFVVQIQKEIRKRNVKKTFVKLFNSKKG